jgi:hypothetical protein
MTENNQTPEINWNRRWIAIVVTALIAWLLCISLIYGLEEYGVALFILIPLFLGAGSAIIHGYKTTITRRQAVHTGLLTLLVFTMGLFFFAIEGLICIFMAAPFGLLLTWVGSLLAYGFISRSPKSSPTIMLLLIASIPATAFIERENEPTLTSVVTTIEIDADPQTVWKNVIQFPELKEPTEFIFKTGIAYPINARMDGNGVGAIRHCNFTTGSFVEPVTVWDEPKLLKFDVEQQPAPMKEMSFWNIDAPHLHDYFVSTQGQFKLIALPNGKTRLEGTTWYYHNIKPAFYWQLWSDQIIHSIHERVLSHIKVNAEADKAKFK